MQSWTLVTASHFTKYRWILDLCESILTYFWKIPWTISLMQYRFSIRLSHLPIWLTLSRKLHNLYRKIIYRYSFIVWAFQFHNRIVFVLKTTLVDLKTYTICHLYPISILDDRTGLNHTLPSTKRYIASNNNSLLFASLRNLQETAEALVDLRRFTQMCNLIP